MPKRSGHTLILLSAIFVCLLAKPAAAYIGPGAGLSAIGALLALVVGIGAAVLGFVWYPIKRVLRKVRAGTEEGSGSGS